MLHNPLHRPHINQILHCDWLQQRPKKPSSPLDDARTIIQKRKKASFWCTKSRKTSPLSPCSTPFKQADPIDCYTKKYNNVPVEKFKNPLDSDTNTVSSSTTVIPITNNLSTFTRNNSLINSSRIVQKRNNVPIEIIQQNDILQVRSYSNDNSMDESLDNDDKDYEKFMMLPTRTGGDPNVFRSLHEFERETRTIMKSYGIECELLENNIEQGPRSEIIGIYRIIITRLKTQREQETTLTHQSPVNDKSSNKNQTHHRHHFSYKNNSRKCAIL